MTTSNRMVCIDTLHNEKNESYAPCDEKIEIGIRRKVLGIITFNLILISVITSALKFSPIVRFYVNENEWILHISMLLFVLTYILLILKRNENFSFIFLLIHLCFQISVVAIYVTYYDLLGVLQGVFLASCVMSLHVLYYLLFQKSCDFRVALFVSCVFILAAVGPFQVMSGCTREELVISVILAICLIFYILCSVNLATNSLLRDHCCKAVITVFIWPCLSLFQKNVVISYHK